MFGIPERNALTRLLPDEGWNPLFVFSPYRPDLNPIERMRSKIKMRLRKTRVMALQDLPAAIEETFTLLLKVTVEGGFAPADIRVNLSDCHTLTT